MSTKRVSIESQYPLEGILTENGRRAGVVICHPHPLYGGSMNNNVVEAIEEGFSEKGFTTLRFNFRGVGGSQGTHDDGHGEVTDLLSAVNRLKEWLDQGASVVLAGYSFGAWICCKASLMLKDMDGLFLVAYPLAFYQPEELALFQKTIYFVGGTMDEICPQDRLLRVYKELPMVNKHIKLIPTDHFYGGKEAEITRFIADEVTFTEQ
jgi:uncharacterized protein